MEVLGEHIRMSQQERLDQYNGWERETTLRESLPVLARRSTRRMRVQSRPSTPRD
jgi:hypothetical protein